MRKLALVLLFLTPALLLADDPIGPGDVQNQPDADYRYNLAMKYRAKTIEYKTAATNLEGSCQVALTTLQMDYNNRQYKQPPMTQAQKTEYTTKYNNAVTAKYACGQNWTWGCQNLSDGDSMRAVGDQKYVNQYYYEAERRYYWCYGSGAAMWDDPNSWEENNGGFYPVASLRFAESSTWHAACIQNCNEARAALSP